MVGRESVITTLQSKSNTSSDLVWKLTPPQERYCLKTFDYMRFFLSSKWRLHRKQEESDPEKESPGVSIIKPLCGGDSNLFQNLETFFNLKYHKVSYHIIYYSDWCLSQMLFPFECCDHKACSKLRNINK